VEDDHTTSEYVTTDPDDELMNEDLDFTPCFGKVGIDLWYSAKISHTSNVFK